jgi:hypothetical protein
VKILLDECVPRQLKRDLVGHDVTTVVAIGWAGIKNGALLRLAETQFDVFITVDRNIQYQQNLQLLKLAIILLVASNTQLRNLRPLIPQVLQLLPTLQPGTLVQITT